MRTLLKVRIPVEAGNEAVRSGKIANVMERALALLKPESSYFLAENDGQRTALFVFDLKDSSDIPPIAELFFLNLNADCQMWPVMNLEDLQAGLKKVQRA